MTSLRTVCSLRRRRKNADNADNVDADRQSATRPNHSPPIHLCRPVPAPSATATTTTSWRRSISTSISSTSSSTSCRSSATTTADPSDPSLSPARNQPTTSLPPTPLQRFPVRWQGVWSDRPGCRLSCLPLPLGAEGEEVEILQACYRWYGAAARLSKGNRSLWTTNTAREGSRAAEKASDPPPGGSGSPPTRATVLAESQ